MLGIILAFVLDDPTDYWSADHYSLTCWLGLLRWPPEMRIELGPISNKDVIRILRRELSPRVREI